MVDTFGRAFKKTSMGHRDGIALVGFSALSCLSGTESTLVTPAASRFPSPTLSACSSQNCCWLS